MNNQKELSCESKHKDTNFESNSQRVGMIAIVGECCESKHKDTNFESNSQLASVSACLISVVNPNTKIQILKAIHNGGWLRILQRTSAVKIKKIVFSFCIALGLHSCCRGRPN